MGCAPSADERRRWERGYSDYTDYGSDEELNPKTREHTRTSLGANIVNRARHMENDRHHSPTTKPKGRFYKTVKRIQSNTKKGNEENEMGMKRLPTRLELMIERMRGRRPKKRKVNLQTETYLRVKEMDRQSREENRMKQITRGSIMQSRMAQQYPSSPLHLVEEEYMSSNSSIYGSPHSPQAGVHRHSPVHSPAGSTVVYRRQEAVSPHRSHWVTVKESLPAHGYYAHQHSPKGSPHSPKGILKHPDHEIHRSYTVYETNGKVSRGTGDGEPFPPSPTSSPVHPTRPLKSPIRNMATQTDNDSGLHSFNNHDHFTEHNASMRQSSPVHKDVISSDDATHAHTYTTHDETAHFNSDMNHDYSSTTGVENSGYSHSSNVPVNTTVVQTQSSPMQEKKSNRTHWAKVRQPEIGKEQRDIEKDRMKMEIFQTAAAGHLERYNAQKNKNDEVNNNTDVNNMSNISKPTPRKENNKVFTPRKSKPSPRNSSPMVPHSRTGVRKQVQKENNRLTATTTPPPRGSRTYQELSHGVRNTQEDAFFHNVSVDTIPKATVRAGTASTA